MIKASFAQSFVDKVNRQLQIRVNIMNEKGIIIASSDPNRIGDFHMIAHEIIRKKQAMSKTDSVTDEMIGVKLPGVNLLMTDGSEPIGVVGVSGDPGEVLHVAKTIKFALESMLEYEEQAMAIDKTRDNMSKLAYALLQENPLNPAKVCRLAGQMGFKSELLRFPILIALSGADSELCLKALIDVYSDRAKYGSQDIVLPMDGQNILYLLSLPSVYEVDYELFAEEVALDIKKQLSLRAAGREFALRFICGIPQTSIIGCASLFRSISWLRGLKSCLDLDVVFLKDYYVEYSVSRIDADDLRPFFDYYVELIKAHLGLDMFLSTAKELIKANMRLDVAASSLFMHKNTVIQRLKKIKDLLRIQPINNPKDAAFLAALYQYMISNC